MACGASEESHYGGLWDAMDGRLLRSVSLVLRESDEESRIALVGASAELFGGKAAGGRLHSTTTTLTAYTEVVSRHASERVHRALYEAVRLHRSGIAHLASRTSHRLSQHPSCVAICALRFTSQHQEQITNSFTPGTESASIMMSANGRRLPVKGTMPRRRRKTSVV